MDAAKPGPAHRCDLARARPTHPFLSLSSTPYLSPSNDEKITALSVREVQSLAASLKAGPGAYSG